MNAEEVLVFDKLITISQASTRWDPHITFSDLYSFVRLQYVIFHLNLIYGLKGSYY